MSDQCMRNSVFTVTFRTDASTDIGTGHVMRCLTLADALREQGATCRFISRDHPGHLLQAIRGRGYVATALPAQKDTQQTSPSDSPGHVQWLGATWEQDADQTLSALAGTRPDWLVVDHYTLEARWERALRAHCRALMCIDDLADREHNADLLVDQNLGRRGGDYEALVPDGCTVLAGTSYALLRPEFQSLRVTSLERRRHCRLEQVFIALGGVDKDNVTSEILGALPSCDLPTECRIVVAVGAQAPWAAHVREAAARLPWPCTVHVDAENVAQLMAESDLAIGAAGTMAWERCSLGLPTLTVVLAANQRAGARALARIGAAIPLEMPISGSGLRDALAQMQEPSVLARMQQAATGVTDGAGAHRVVAEMRRQHGCG